MLLQVAATQGVEDAAIHQVALEDVAVLGQAQFWQKLVGHPRHVQVGSVCKLAGGQNREQMVGYMNLMTDTTGNRYMNLMTDTTRDRWWDT